MKTLELSEGELELISAVFSAKGISVPMEAVQFAASIQNKLAGLRKPAGPRLVGEGD